MVNPRLDSSGKYVTDDYIGELIGILLNSIFDLHRTFRQYAPRTQDFVICLDDKVNWRKEVLPSYKGTRPQQRQQSKINYPEVFKSIEEMTNVLKESLPYRVLKGDNAEGDDTILVLCERYAKSNKILILSSDKDMIQATKFGCVKQYSLLTRRFMNFGTKGELTLDDWLLDHVALGDACDCVPKIVDGTVFTQEFKDFLSSKSISLTPLGYWRLKQETRDLISSNFSGDIFTKIRFGAKTLRKRINEAGSLDKFLDMNPLYRLNWERNERLVLADGIPSKVKDSILAEFEHTETSFKEREFQTFLRKYNLDNMMFNLPSDLYTGQEITADAFNCA